MMRKRLARAYVKAMALDVDDPDDLAQGRIAVDAILREMMEPDDDTITAAYMPDQTGVQPVLAEQVFRAMLQHILDEGRSVEIPHRGKVNTKDQPWR